MRRLATVTVTGCQGGPHAVGILGQFHEAGPEANVDVREAVESGAQEALEVGLGEMILERVPVSPLSGAAGMDERSSVDSVVPGTRPRHDDRVDGFVQVGQLQCAQRLVVQADRLRFVARGRVPLDDQDAHTERAQEVGRGEPDRSRADDEHQWRRAGGRRRWCGHG